MENTTTPDIVSAYCDYSSNTQTFLLVGEHAFGSAREISRSVYIAFSFKLYINRCGRFLCKDAHAIASN